MSVLRGSVNCECGYVHDLEEFPCPTVWRASRDTDGWDFRQAYFAQARLQELTPGSPEYKSLLWADTQMDRILTFIFECPHCGRLIWNRGEPFPDRVYRLERERSELPAGPDRGSG
jgi:hypothetical protein